MGHLDVLNCGLGHIRLTATGDDPIEKERFRRCVLDMLHRGYSLFLEKPDGGLIPVRSFDAESAAYIISDVPGIPEEWESTISTKEVPKSTKGRTKKVPADKAKGVAIGRSSGG